MRAHTFGFLLICIVTLFSCEQTSERYFVSHEMREWPFLDQLPVSPDSVTWGSLQLGLGDDRIVPGPTDHYVQAVIYYNDSSFAELLSKVDSGGGDSPLVLDSENFQQWFPAEVKAVFHRDGIKYTSSENCFSLKGNEAWLTRCLIAKRNILFLTYTTN